MCIHNTTNTIDYTFHNNHALTDQCDLDSGYVPDKGYIISNFDDLLSEEMAFNHTNLNPNINNRDNVDLNIKEINARMAILFTQKSPNHKFNKPYSEFLTFCLSMMIDPTVGTNFFNLALSEIPFDY